MSSKPVLVVDLDGTLLKSDMLYETFWSAFARDWKMPFVAMAALTRGRAALKTRMAELSDVDIPALPWNEAARDYVARWRAEGGRTALVSAADDGVVQQVAAHLGLFDEAHGTNGENLKGAAKARFLREHLGDQPYIYMGDSTADLAVWEASSGAVTVTADRALRDRATGLHADAHHIDTDAPRWRRYLDAMRPHQWLKNLLVLIPLLAGHRFEPATLLLALLAFAAFSLTASGVYVLNDMLDLASDRAHPRKRNRPFASGDIPIAHGTVMAPLLLGAGLLLALAVTPAFFVLLLIYFAITMAYSLHLKRLVVVDICVLAILYTMRILAGGAAAGVPISVWLLAFSVFLFFGLAAIKRQAELEQARASGKTMAHGRGYRADDLVVVQMLAVASGFIAVLVMALYVTSPKVSALYSNPEMLLGVCLVLLYWFARVAVITHRGEMHDDPVVFAARDRASQVCALLILGLAFAGAVL